MLVSNGTHPWGLSRDGHESAPERRYPLSFTNRLRRLETDPENDSPSGEGSCRAEHVACIAPLCCATECETNSLVYKRFETLRSEPHGHGSTTCSAPWAKVRIVADQPFRACGPRLMDFGTVQAGFHSVWPRIFTASRRRQTASTPSGHGVMSVHGTTIEHSPHDRAGAAAAKSITAGGDGRST